MRESFPDSTSEHPAIEGTNTSTIMHLEPSAPEEPEALTQNLEGYSVPGVIETNIPRVCFEVNDAGRLFLPAYALDMLGQGDYTIDTPYDRTTLSVILDDRGRRFIAMTAENVQNDLGVISIDVDPDAVVLKRSPLNGVVFSRGSANQVDIREHTHIPSTIMAGEMGYMTMEGDDEYVLTPTPETLALIAQEHDLPIEVIYSANSEGFMTIDSYLQAFANGNYPVGAGELELYVHDVKSNDHIAGVAVLGRKGLDMLSPIAQHAMEAELTHEEKGEIGKMYDGITAIITTVINRPLLEIVAAEGTSESRNDRIIDSLQIQCHKLAAIANKYSVKVSDREFFDLVRARINEIAGDNAYGEQYDNFIEQLNGYEYVEFVPVAEALDEDYGLVDI